MTLMPTNILPTQSYPFGPTGGKTGLRHLFQMLSSMQEGVAPFGGGAGGDLKVTQRSAGGAGQAVDVAAGEALILGDDTTRQGIYHQTADAVETVALPAASAAQPRFDQLIIHVYDSSITGGSDTPLFEVLQGTAQAGVTIDNRLGAAALPNNAIRLAEWVTPASAGAYTLLSTAIRDRRPWARGAQWSTVYTAGANLTTTTTVLIRIDATNLQPRIESSGVPLEISLNASGYHSVANAGVELSLAIDGSTEVTNAKRRHASNVAGIGPLWAPRWIIAAPPVGTHLWAPMWAGGVAGTLTMLLTAGYAAELLVRELVGQNAQNSGA
jgi:hypothetical protein